MEVLLYSIVGLVLLVLAGSVFRRKKGSGEKDEPTKLADSDCCGAHEVCEAESLMNHTNKPVYFEDEELDRFSGKETDSYSEKDISEFQDILYTLKDTEVSGWLRSLQLRNIEPPLSVREEALLIVSERRFGS